MQNQAIEMKYRLIKDPYRPTYHFAFPYGCDGFAGDPNGAFFADGRYHLMFLYKTARSEGKGCLWHWGHISSHDLISWRHHEDALSGCESDADLNKEAGYFSGGAFLDDDGTAYISAWFFPREGKDKGGIGLAKANAPYERWEIIEPLILETAGDKWGVHERVIDGKTRYLGCSDPSNIWKKDGFYYIQLGNLPVLIKTWEDGIDEEEYKSGWTELFRSRDLKNWEFVHRFYDKPTCHTDSELPGDREDDMCPSFLPLYDKEENGSFTGKYLQLFISHERGCQYFIGHLEGESFIPESHGRMTWNDNHFFAPEALTDDRGRHIMWAWMAEGFPWREKNIDLFGYNGVFSLPRCLWLEDGVLKMSPVSELERLEYNKSDYDVTEITDGEKIPVKNPVSFRMRAHFKVSGKCGFTVLEDLESGERAEIYYLPVEKRLVFDAKGIGDRPESIKEEAPFELYEGEELSLDIFVDKSMVEVYANKRQAICRRVFPRNPEKCVDVRVIGNGLCSLSVSEMSPSFEM